MPRKLKQSFNSSFVSNKNDSILSEGSPEDINYSTFIKRFGRDFLNEEICDFIGSLDAINALERKINSLLDNTHCTALRRKLKFSLLTGSSGSGKTAAVRHLGRKYLDRVTFLFLESSWILEKEFGNTRSRLRSLFDEAIKSQPSIIFIDEIDLICPTDKRTTGTRDKEQLIFLDLLKGFKHSDDRVFIFAATNQQELISEKLRNAYFVDEIHFSFPKKQDRISFFKTKCPDLKDEELDNISDLCQHYNIEDLQDLIDNTKELNNNLITIDTLKDTRNKFKPPLIKSRITECPKVFWHDIGGVDEIKRELIDTLIWPLRDKEKFSAKGGELTKGILLYGPPGCSKTMLAKACATESGYNFIEVKGPQLISKYVGDSEAAVRKLYREAREIAPCIIFFDEIDGFAPQRSNSNTSSASDRVVTQLLGELNDNDSVFTIAATNNPEQVDRALLRPGRIYPKVYVPLPCASDRKEIFKVCLRKICQLDDLTLDELVSKSEGYSGADIREVCQTALKYALKNDANVMLDHFLKALEKVIPDTDLSMLERYENFKLKGKLAKSSISSLCKSFELLK